jgi:hypothetical protein
LRREGAQWQSEHKVMSRQVEEVAVGELHLEMVGLAWLSLEVVGVSIPNESSNLILLL